ncbi:hypothetical protein FGG08_002316 [Glutinoglossum americanum]|uniref:Tyrosyl-DNA phosphodiesterase n=1 Tax=Glutinoglossum americanum TaxID=1670608 RepID=A0A9P8IBV4_9PEZI|nr:hypothetical protein FGG08_002316 [Glutinoglossum americanum]
MSDDWDEESQLHMAIALSLQQQPETPSLSPQNAKIIDLCSDEETEVSKSPTSRKRPRGHQTAELDGQHGADIRYPWNKTHSMFSQRTEQRASGSLYSIPENNSSGKFSRGVRQETSPKATSFLGGIDRKKMEEERLARKRKAPISPPPGRVVKATKKVEYSGIAVSGNTSERGVQDSRSQFGSSSLPTSARGEANLSLSNGTNSVQNTAAPTGSGIQYPKGTVKKTWAQGYQRDGDVKLEEVLQKLSRSLMLDDLRNLPLMVLIYEQDDLRTAILSAFQWDVDWVFSKLNMDKVKLFFVMQAKDKEMRMQYLQDSAHMSNLILCFPPMPGNVTCMHSKLQLLFHPSHLRIVVPSANLTPYDWGEDGTMENMVFMIDLPRLTGGQVVGVEDLTFFGKELVHFLQAMGLDEKVIKGVLNFDFRETSELAFVHTIRGGSHSGEDWKRTGYCGLGTAIRRLGLQTSDQLRMDIVTSSLGSLDERFLMTMYLAAQGDNGLKEYNMRNKPSKARQKTKGMTESESSDDTLSYLSGSVRSNVQVYFPTRDTVANSKGGIDVRWGNYLFSIEVVPRFVISPSTPTRLQEHPCRSTNAQQGKLQYIFPEGVLSLTTERIEDAFRSAVLFETTFYGSRECSKKGMVLSW